MAPDEAGARLDSYLAARTGAISRSRIKSLILEGYVTRDGMTTRDASETVQAGATYSLTAPAPTPAIPQGENISLKILYEDA